MNFDDAVQARATCKIKLSTYLDKKDGSLRAPEARAIISASLGSGYMASAGSILPIDYKTSIDEHTRIHRAAGDEANSAGD